MTDNPYYEYFKVTLQSAEDIEQKGGKFYDSSIGHVYEAPRPYFRGRGLAGPAYSIRGEGIGNILGRLFKWSQPLLRRLGQKVFDSAANVATNVAHDAIQGENIIESTKKHGSVEGKQFLKEIPEQVGDFISNKLTSSSSGRSVSSSPESEKGVLGKNSGPKVISTARNAIRASSKRPSFAQKKKNKIGRGRKLKNKKQRGGGFSAIYPALELMQ
jgi:hypothetical protein